VNEDGLTKVTVYRKPTHTDQYLNLHSSHHVQHKRAAVNTLLLRAQNLVPEEDVKVKEIQHIKEAGNSFQHFSNSYTLKHEYHHCLTSDATVLVSRKCPAIGEPIMVIVLA